MTSHDEEARRAAYLQTPLRQIDPSAVESVRDLLLAMSETSYQARYLGTALKIWEEMLQAKTTIFFAFAGAMTAAGMRTLVSFLIRQRLIDVLVSTGANLSHDAVETLGYYHYLGHPEMDDLELGELKINRVYDNLVPEEGFIRSEDYITEVVSEIEQRPYGTRELLHLLGGKFKEVARAEGILTTAHDHQLPIYCPALADSSIGMGLANARHQGKTFQIDVLKDVIETSRIVRETKLAGGETGLVVIGGGTPRNFSQQAAVATYMFKDPQKYEHKYVVVITIDPPHWGSLSGSTPEEAQSWRKFQRDARMTSVLCDGTIALPLLVRALVEGRRGEGRQRPVFEPGPDLNLQFRWK